MGVRLTFGLVVVAAVALILGYATHTKWIIYLSIACSFLAFVGLLMSSRKRRKHSRAQAADDMSWTASLAEPAPTRSMGVVLPLPLDDGEGMSVPVRRRAVPAAASASASASTRSKAGRGRSATPALSGPVRRSGRFVEPFADGEPEGQQEPESDWDWDADRDDGFDAVGTPGRSLGRASASVPVPARGRGAAREPDDEPRISVSSNRRRALEPEPAGYDLDDEPAPVARRLPPRPGSPKRNAVPADWVQHQPEDDPEVRPALGRSARAGRVTPVSVAPQPVARAARSAAPGPASAAPASAPAPLRGARSAPAPAPARAPAAVAAPAPATPRRRPQPPPVSDYPFPIEDYDYLGPADILPLLPELDDEELVEVLLHEQRGPNRASILDRIDALLEGEDW